MTDDRGPSDPGPDDRDGGWPDQGGPEPGYQAPGYHQPGYQYPPRNHPRPGYPQAGPGQDHFGGPAYGQPGYASYGSPVPAGSASQNANVALGLSVGGLASYLIGFCCAPLAIIGLILCGVGLFMGYREAQAIERHLADPAGKGTARAAQIVGGIGVGLFVVVLLLFGFFFGASALL